MKGFKLDENNDVIISETYHDIELTQDDDLTRQMIQTTLGTNKGEWFFDLSEGINHKNILGKNKNKDIIRSEVVRGIAQVDEALVLQNFQMDLDHERRAKVKFTAQSRSGNTEEVEVSWQ